MIDTCNWKSLVSKISYNDQVDQILIWIQQGDLIFLISNVLRKEWDKHRKEEMEAITEKVKAHATQFRRGKLFGREIDNEPLPLDEAEELLKRQIETIDLIFGSGLAIDISDAVRATVVKHFEGRLPPFHNKLDSHKDAKILFPALEYVNSLAKQKELTLFHKIRLTSRLPTFPAPSIPFLQKYSLT